MSLESIGKKVLNTMIMKKTGNLKQKEKKTPYVLVKNAALKID